MSYQLSIYHKAELEYEGAYNWCKREQDGLEERFFNAINKKLQQILSGPELYSVKNDNSCREAIVNGFPYVIIYRINKQSLIITIVAIHHTSRRPKKRFVK